MKKPQMPAAETELSREETPFLYWSENGTGPKGSLEMLQDRLTNLIAAYTQKGMTREAQIFREHLDRLKQIHLDLE